VPTETEAVLRRKKRPDDADAFVTDTTEERRPLAEADAEALAEEFIGAVTRGESLTEDAEDEVASDEDGGPYLVLEEEELVEEEFDLSKELDSEPFERIIPSAPDTAPRRAR
jgi:hypothetical protein